MNTSSRTASGFSRMLRTLADLALSALARFKKADHTFMAVLAVMIGCFGGLGAVAFRAFIRLVQSVAWGSEPYSLEVVRSHTVWWIVLVPALGGLVVGPLVHFFAKEARGHGVPEVMEAVALRSGVMRPRLVVVKALASGLCIGSGGSVGREGPIAQIGSALGSTIGQLFRVSGKRLRTLVGCGAAAGVAATFNAPVAGALFAVEIILGDFAVSRFSPIVISSVIATVVSRHFLGDVPAFVVPAYEMVSAWELVTYGVLGLVAGAVALAFVRVLSAFEDVAEKLPGPPWLLAPIGGLLVGLLGVRFPEVLGVGYEGIEGALSGSLPIVMLGSLMVVKLLATTFTLSSGGSGGIFAPSLFLGAMTGGLVGSLAHQWFPQITAGSGAYALVGMGAVVAAATHAPITAILILFELTSDYKLILPLMTSCIVATLVSTRVSRESIYTIKLLRRGVNLFHGRESNLLKAVKVGEVLEAEPGVPSDLSLGELLVRASATRRPYCYLVDAAGRLEGVLSVEQLSQLVRRKGESGLPTTARDLVLQEVPAVSPEDDLDAVMRIFAGKNREELPVVDPRTGKFEGTVTRAHLIDAYQSELMKREMAESLGSSLEVASTETVELGSDYQMSEIDAPSQLVGQSLGAIGVRARHGLQVVLIRRKDTAGRHDLESVPDAETVVETGDRLVCIGRRSAIARFRSL